MSLLACATACLLSECEATRTILADRWPLKRRSADSQRRGPLSRSSIRTWLTRPGCTTTAAHRRRPRLPIDAQFPEWSGQAIEPIVPWGTDNAMFRLGDDKVLRLPPGSSRATGRVERPQWLPALARNLPLRSRSCWQWAHRRARVPVGLGRLPRWLEGETFPAERVGERSGEASTVARFLLALRQIDTSGGPASGSGPLAARTSTYGVRSSR